MTSPYLFRTCSPIPTRRGQERRRAPQCSLHGLGQPSEKQDALSRLAVAPTVNIRSMKSAAASLRVPPLHFGTRQLAVNFFEWEA